MRTAASLAYSLALLLGTVLHAQAAGINVSGTLIGDVTWTAAQSPIQVQGDVVLDQGATLTIEPGVLVRMEPSASFTLHRGAVHAVGTTDQPIVITSASAEPAPGDWGEWRFLEGTRAPQTRLAHMRIEYGSGVVIQKSSPTLNHMEINHHSGPAIRMDLESSPSGQGLRAKGNALNAIVVPSGVVRGQILWDLVGIPYLVRQGMVQVGQAPLAIEPSRLELGSGASASMRVVLGEPAPAGGRVVNMGSNPTGGVIVAPSVMVPEGAATMNFEVRGHYFGETVLTANSPGVGAAQARVSVIRLPSIYFDTAIGALGNGLPYTIRLRLSTAAPAGGLTLRLGSEPANAFELPATVHVPEGDSEVSFTARSLVTGMLRMTVQAAGYSEAARQFESRSPSLRLELPGLQAPIVAGLDYTGAVHLEPSAPSGGMVVRLTSSDPLALSLSAEQITIPEGQTYVQQAGLLRAQAKGLAQIVLSANGVPDAAFGPFDIQSPTTLKWRAHSYEATKVWVGRKLLMNQGISIARLRDDVELRESRPLQVQLRCRDAAVCSVPPSVTIPAWESEVFVPITGLVLGETEIEAQAEGTQVAVFPVQVIEPQVQWDFSERHYVSMRRYASICLSVPEAGRYSSQQTTDDWILALTVRDQSPVGTIAAIYDGDDSRVQQVKIKTTRRCSDPFYIEAAQRGDYRIGAEMEDRLSAVSELQTVYGDRALTFMNWNTEGSDIAVVEGFVADLGIVTEYQGSWETTSRPLTVRLRCIDAAVCSTPAEITIPAGDNDWGVRAFPITGLRPGSTQIEASVLGEPESYPDVYTTLVEVTEKKWSIAYSTGSIGIGSEGQVNVCIGDKWGSSGYSPNPMSVTISSSAPAVLKLNEEITEWPAGESCIRVHYTGVAEGTATLTVSMPGLPTLAESVEVRP